MKLRVSVLAVFILPLLSFSAFALEVKPELSWQQLYRYDLRRQHDQLYVNRLCAAFEFSGQNRQKLFKIIPFVEMRRNIDRDSWERKEAGVELGKDITPWLYLGQAIQKTWTREDTREYGDIEKRHDTESESRLILSHSLLKTAHFNLKGFILGEYTYNFNDGQAVRNEMAVGLTVPIGSRVETGINWRHIDRIHHYDSDVVEAQIATSF